MPVDMERLLRQDMLAFTPVVGSFDVETLAAGIAAIDYSLRDKAQPGRFVIVPEPGWRDAIATAREADPKSPFPGVVNVEAHPGVVMVWPAIDQPGLAAISTRLLKWLLDSYECHIENDLGIDMLARPAGSAACSGGAARRNAD